MAAPQRSPHALLERLKAALPQAKPRHIVGAAGMAEIVGMSWRNLLDRYITPDAAFPIKTRGTNGKGYEFQVAKVLRHMIVRTEQRIAADARKADDLARLMHFEVPAGSPPMQSVREVRDLIDTQLRIDDARRRQGEHVPVDQLKSFVADLFSTVMEGLIGEGAKIDPTGQLPPELREAVENDMRDLSNRIYRKVQDFLGTLNAPNQPGADVRAGRRTGG